MSWRMHEVLDWVSVTETTWCCNLKIELELLWSSNCYSSHHLAGCQIHYPFYLLLFYAKISFITFIFHCFCFSIWKMILLDYKVIVPFDMVHVVKAYFFVLLSNHCHILLLLLIHALTKMKSDKVLKTQFNLPLEF